MRASPNHTPSHEQVVRGMELVHAIQSLPTLPDDTTRPQQLVLIEDCGEVDPPTSDGAPPTSSNGAPPAAVDVRNNLKSRLPPRIECCSSGR